MRGAQEGLFLLKASPLGGGTASNNAAFKNIFPSAAGLMVPIGLPQLPQNRRCKHISILVNHGGCCIIG